MDPKLEALRKKKWSLLKIIKLVVRLLFRLWNGNPNISVKHWSHTKGISDLLGKRKGTYIWISKVFNKGNFDPFLKCLREALKPPRTFAFRHCKLIDGEPLGTSPSPTPLCLNPSAGKLVFYRGSWVLTRRQLCSAEIPTNEKSKPSLEMWANFSF